MSGKANNSILIRVSRVLPSSVPHHCAGSVPGPEPQDVLSQEVTGEWGILTMLS